MPLRIKHTLVPEAAVEPYDEIIHTPGVVVGSPPQWGDNSDASYSTAYGIAHTNDPNFGGGASSFLGPYPDFQFSAVDGINLRVRVKGTGHDVRMPNVTLKMLPGTDTKAAYWGGDPMPTTPTWLSFPMSAEGGWTFEQVLVQMREGGFYIESRAQFGPDPGFTYENSWTIYEMRFDVMIEGPREAPMCRKFPVEPAGRHFPPGKSQQRSGRRFGHY